MECNFLRLTFWALQLTEHIKFESYPDCAFLRIYSVLLQQISMLSVYNRSNQTFSMRFSLNITITVKYVRERSMALDI